MDGEDVTLEFVDEEGVVSASVPLDKAWNGGDWNGSCWRSKV